MTPKIKAAEAKLKAKQLLAAQAEDVMNAARAEVGKAEVELASARREHDLTLPKAIVLTKSRYAKDFSESVAVLRKTEKSAFVRAIGSPDEKVRQFRMGKDGVWREYAASARLAFSVRELIFDGEKK